MMVKSAIAKKWMKVLTIGNGTCEEERATIQFKGCFSINLMNIDRIFFLESLLLFFVFFFIIYAY